MSEASKAAALAHAATIYAGSGDSVGTMAAALMFHEFIVGADKVEAPKPAPAKPAAAKPTKPVAEPEPDSDSDAPAEGEVTKEQVGEAIEQLLNANLRKAAIALFAKYGAKSLSGVKPEDYAAIKQDAEDALMAA